MGTFSTLIEIGNIDGGVPIQIEATVDTGALHTMISQSLSEQLHMRHQGYEEFGLADGTLVSYPVGTARVIVLDRDRWCPVIFGPDAECLLGATTLEILGFVVDPIAERLLPVTRRARPF